MGLEIKIHLSSHFQELVERYPYYKDIIAFSQSLPVLTTISGRRFSKNGKQVSIIPLLFIGKTGYGKSSTINRIIGKNTFRTSDIDSCTKELQAAEYFLTSKSGHDYYFIIMDAPGIGESIDIDNHYLKLYSDIISFCGCIIYVLRADQRDYALDLQAFNKVFENKSAFKRNVIIGLNCVDKIEPISRIQSNNLQLSSMQKLNLVSKVNTVSNIFEIPQHRIIPYSAIENYNIDMLLKTSKQIIIDNVFHCQ